MISYIIPAYNCRDTVTATIDSIIGQDANTDFEIIVVNDGSQDDTRAVVEQYITAHPGCDILLINQNNQGIGLARNSGMDKARGELVCFIDSDDICLPGYTEKLVSGLGEDCDFCFSSVRKVFKDAGEKVVNASNTVTGIQAPEKVFIDFIAEKMNIVMCASVYKMSIIRANGLKFSNIRYAEDLNFIHRYLLCCKKVNIINDVLYQYNCCSERFKLREAQELDLGEYYSIYELALEGVKNAGWEKGYLALKYGRIPLDYMTTCLKKAYYSDSYDNFRKWLLSGDPSNRKIICSFRYKGFKVKTCIKASLVSIGFLGFPRLSYAITKRLYSKVYYGIE